jgi:hypothetical protein
MRVNHFTDYRLRVLIDAAGLPQARAWRVARQPTT